METTQGAFVLKGDRLKYINNIKTFLKHVPQESDLNYEFPLRTRRFSAPQKFIVQSANIYRNLE
jgi:hypothetical protein